MTGFPGHRRDLNRMALDDFLWWLQTVPQEMRETRVRLYGKLRVRVPVERQVPNEADL